MIIKRGSYTRVSAEGIESNEGTFFESIMSPVFDIQLDAADASGSDTVAVAKSHFSIVGISCSKIGAGGVGDSLTLKNGSDAICTFAVATASDGDWLLPEALDEAFFNFVPGDSLVLTSVKAAGSPAAEVHIQVRID